MFLVAEFGFRGEGSLSSSGLQLVGSGDWDLGFRAEVSGFRL